MDKVVFAPSLQIEAFQSGQNNNSYLVTCPRADNALIVDAPDQPTELIKCVHERGTAISTIIITHEHWDHVDGLGVLLDNFNVPIQASPHLQQTVAKHSPKFIGLMNDSEVSWGQLSLKALATPGHTLGSTCYFMAGTDDLPPFLFSGDTLFPGGPGKTNSRADFCSLIESLEAKIFSLPKRTIVLPGHGASTTIEQSLNEYNVFKQNSNGNEYGQVTWL